MANEVINALEEQVGLYRRLAKLAELQHEFVQQGQTEELLDVLGKRQEVLNQVARLEETIAPVRRRWSAYVVGLNGSQRSQAEELMIESQRLLEDITNADRNDAMVLQQRKLNLGKQINQAQVARQVNKSYAASAYGQNRISRMDVRGE